MDVVVAARVCAAAHGEQVAVTRATRDMAGEVPLPSATFRPLGHHRLKDVPAAAQLFQLVAPGLREDFPPLKTLTATSLPALHHRLVGRADALARVEGLLESGVRLVTITGPGGAGKSRLALEVAARAALDRPVHLVGLAPVIDAELVPSAIARAIGARESGDRSTARVGRGQPERRRSARSSSTTSSTCRRPPRQLPSCSTWCRICRSWQRAARRSGSRPSTCTRSRRSRSRMRPRCSSSWPRRAASCCNESALASVHEICRKLDGLPLAIELVAARLAVLPPAEILRALGEGLALEMEGPVDLPERQRTLRAAIDWSYGRLSPSQRALHGALAVFADSGSLDDVRAVARAGPGFLRDLEALVGWSLVRGESTDGERTALDAENGPRVRTRALQTPTGSLDELQQRHADRFLELALEAEAELAGPEQAAWLDRLEGEFDNVARRPRLAALLGSGRGRSSGDLGSRALLARACARQRGPALAGRSGSRSGADVPADVRADALRTAARQAAAQSDWGAARPARRGARALPRAGDASRGDLRTLVAQLLSRSTARRRSVRSSSTQGGRRGRQPTGRRSRVVGGADVLGDVYSARGEHARALAQLRGSRRAPRRSRRPAAGRRRSVQPRHGRFPADDLERARASLRRALEQARDLGEEAYIAAAQLHARRARPARGRSRAAPSAHRESTRGSTRELEDDRSQRALRASSSLGASTAERGEAARTQPVCLGAADGTPRRRSSRRVRGAGARASILARTARSVSGATRSRALTAEGARLAPSMRRSSRRLYRSSSTA